MYIRVLGAAAGGGYPQWNCNHPNGGRTKSKGDPSKGKGQLQGRGRGVAHGTLHIRNQSRTTENTLND